MTTTAEHLVDELNRACDGQPWHGASVMRILEGVDAAMAVSRPLPHAHSIWELVLHLTAWAEEVTRRLGGAAAAEPAAGDWPPVPGVADAAAWQHACDALAAAHRQLAVAVIAGAARLDDPVSDARDTAPGTGVTHRATISGLLQHDAYHAGQIALLRKAAARG